jgi:hypothetical protein
MGLSFGIAPFSTPRRCTVTEPETGPEKLIDTEQAITQLKRFIIPEGMLDHWRENDFLPFITKDMGDGSLIRLYDEGDVFECCLEFEKERRRLLETCEESNRAWLVSLYDPDLTLGMEDAQACIEKIGVPGGQIHVWMSERNLPYVRLHIRGRDGKPTGPCYVFKYGDLITLAKLYTKENPE